MTQQRNKIAINQEQYDRLDGRKDLIAIGIDEGEFNEEWFKQRQKDDSLVTSWIKALSEFVVIDPLAGRSDDIETDAQFIADWTAWAAARERWKITYSPSTDLVEYPPETKHVKADGFYVLLDEDNE